MSTPISLLVLVTYLLSGTGRASVTDSIARQAKRTENWMNEVRILIWLGLHILAVYKGPSKALGLIVTH